MREHALSIFLSLAARSQRRGIFQKKKKTKENKIEENEIEENNDFILMPMQEGLKMGEIRFPKEEIFRPKQDILKTFGYRPDSQEQLMELAER